MSYKYLSEEENKSKSIVEKKKSINDLVYLSIEERKKFVDEMDDYEKFLKDYSKEMYDNYCKKTGMNCVNLFVDHNKHILVGLEKKEKEFNMKADILLIAKFKEEYKKLKIENEKRVNKVKLLLAERKAETERIVRNERRKGHSNIKPISFYEEMYIYGDEYEDKERIKKQREYDTYFEEFGKPKGEFKEIETKSKRGFQTKRTFWRGDYNISLNNPERYISADTPEENQKYLNRCREIVNILIDLRDCESYQQDLKYMEILQKYLTEGYLITRQIAWYPSYLNSILVDEVIRIPDEPYRHIKNHPAEKYEIGIYNDDFNINQIYEDVDKFVAITKPFILTPIRKLKKFLKEHDNQISIVRYASIINNTYYVAKRILEGFVKDRKLKFKKVGKAHKLIFYV